MPKVGDYKISKFERGYGVLRLKSSYSGQHHGGQDVRWVLVSAFRGEDFRKLNTRTHAEATALFNKKTKGMNQ